MIMQGCVVLDEQGRRQLLDAKEGVSVVTDLFLLQTEIKAGGTVVNAINHTTEQEAVTCHDLLATVLHQGDQLNMSVH